MINKKVWNFYLNHSISDWPVADPEQESKILRYPPPEVLRSSWYLNKNVLTVQIKAKNLKPLIELDQDKARNSDLGLQRLLSIVTSCERLEEELLNVEPLFLHPALIYFSTYAKILTLPFPPEEVSAGSQLNKTVNPWIFSSVNTEDPKNSSLATLLRWIEKNYAIKKEVVEKLMPLCRTNKYRKLRLTLSEQTKADEEKARISVVTGSNDSEGKTEDKFCNKKLNIKQESQNTNQQKRKSMDISTNTDKIKNATTEDQNKNKKSGGFLSNLRLRYSRDFQQTEKTFDLVLEDPFFRMACLSEGLPGTKEEKLGHRAFILVEEFLIGRDSDTVDFWIDSQNVSRQQARIIRRQGSFFLEDLGSRNSTLLDGKKVNKHKEYLLPDKCRLTFADKAYYFEASS